MKPERVAKTFVHELGIGGFNGLAYDKHHVMKFGVAARRPAAQINRQELFSGLIGHKFITPAPASKRTVAVACPDCPWWRWETCRVCNRFAGSPGSRMR